MPLFEEIDDRTMNFAFTLWNRTLAGVGTTETGLQSGCFRRKKFVIRGKAIKLAETLSRRSRGRSGVVAETVPFTFPDLNLENIRLTLVWSGGR